MNVRNQWAAATELPEKPVNLEFKDRSTGLAIFGSLQVVMGVLFALMVPLIFLTSGFGPAGAGTSTAQIIPAAGIYAMLAIVLVSLGVGSILARRWARALTLVLAWMWLVMGVVALISMVFLMPSMSDMMAAQTQQPPPVMMKAIFAMMIAMMAVMYVVLPGIFIIFYQRPDVKATCEWKDTKVRWTDRCPLPVLSLSLVLAFGATSVVWGAGYGFVAPFFGVLLKGVPGALLFVSISLLFGYLSWAIYKQKMAAWWATLGVIVLFGLSTIISFSVIDMIDLYREMDFPKEQLDAMERSGALDMNIPLMMAVNMVALVGYLFWVRRFFDVLPHSQTSDSQTSALPPADS